MARHFSISFGELAFIRTKSNTNGMSSTQGLDIKKGQYAGRFVKFEARNVSYELVSLSAWLEWGGGALTFYDLAEDTGRYRGHGLRKGVVDESDNEFVEGGMTEWACYPGKFTFGGDKGACPD